MKRLFCILLSLTMSITAFACTKPNKENNVSPDTNMGEDSGGVLTDVYTGHEFVLPVGNEKDMLFDESITPYISENRITFACEDLYHNGENLRRDYHLLTYDCGEEITLVSDVKAELDFENIYAIDSGVITEDNFIICVTDFDFGTTSLYSYNISDSTILTIEDVYRFFSEDSMYIDDICLSGEYICLMNPREAVFFDSSLVMRFSITSADLTPTNYINSICASPDGKFYVFASDYEAEDNAVFICDAENQTMSEAIPFDVNVRRDTCLSGTQLYANLRDGIHLIDPESGGDELIFNYQNSSIDANAILLLGAVSDGFFVNEDNGRMGKPMLYLPDDDIVIDSITVLDMAICYPIFSNITSAVSDFNRTHRDVRIRITDYSEYTEDYSGSERLMTDMVSSLYKPDIVYASGSDQTVIDALTSHKMYTDLYSLMTEEDKEDMFDGIKRVFSDGDRMWGIADQFYVWTAFAKDSIPGEYADGWNLTEMLDFTESLPDSCTLTEGLTQRFNISLGLGENLISPFIDVKNGECDFECDDFIRLIEFLKSLPKEKRGAANPDNIYEAYQSGKSAVYRCELRGFYNYAELYAVFGGEEFTHIGFPAHGDNSGAYLSPSNFFVITDSCADKDSAWEFVTSCIKPEFNGAQYFLSGMFPIFESMFDTLCGDAYNTEYQIFFDGRHREYPADRDDAEKPLPYPGVSVHLSESDVENMKKIFNSAGSPIIETLPYDVYAIINEELSAYFSDVKSAGDTASVIQSRVKLWLGERKN
ncbi:MAG: hypothetical protein ACI4XJ_07535 [Eubacteriales bacterium]